MTKYIEITTNFSNEGTRNEVRMRIVERFSQELPGSGRDDKASRYKYFVETLSDGNRVYLQRPANLHNGFDFLVCVENMNYAPEGKKKRNYPKHEDLEIDLLQKRHESPKEYKKLYSLLEKIFHCQNVEDIEMTRIQFVSGLPVDHNLKTIKWLFIEQDIRYWNYSGRSMTWGIVPKP